MSLYLLTWLNFTHVICLLIAILLPLQSWNYFEVLKTFNLWMFRFWDFYSVYLSKVITKLQMFLKGNATISETVSLKFESQTFRQNRVTYHISSHMNRLHACLSFWLLEKVSEMFFITVLSQVTIITYSKVSETYSRTHRITYAIHWNFSDRTVIISNKTLMVLLGSQSICFITSYVLYTLYYRISIESVQ